MPLSAHMEQIKPDVFRDTINFSPVSLMCVHAQRHRADTLCCVGSLKCALVCRTYTTNVLIWLKLSCCILSQKKSRHINLHPYPNY